MTTGFFWDERCFWHGGGDYAFTLPPGALAQPLANGLPENPENQTAAENLLDVTGLIKGLHPSSAAPACAKDLARVHPTSYRKAFKALSDQRGGDLGLRAPFGQGGYEIATLSAGPSPALP